MSGGIDKTFVPKQVPVRSDSEPDLEEGQLWYDTANSSLKRMQANGNFTSIGSNPDQVSIVEDSNGDLKVEFDGDTLTVGSNGLEVNKPQTMVVSQLDSVYMSNLSDNEVRDKNQTVDLTDVGTLVVDLEVHNENSGGNTTGYILVANNTEANLGASGSPETNRNTFEIDVSNYSGDTQLTVRADDGYNGGGWVKTHQFDGEKQNRVIV